MPAGVEPRPYQHRIVHKTIGFFAEAFNSVMIQSPTGSGKTVIGMAIARHVQNEWGLRVGWMAMRRNLLNQARQTNESMGFNVDIRYISMFDRDVPEVDFLITDEAQHDAATSAANVHSKIKPKFILGLTATPYRTDSIKLCFQKQINDAGIRELIQDGYLSPFHHYTMPNYKPVDVADVYGSDPDRWGQSLAFFHQGHECRAFQQRLLDRWGIHCEMIYGQSDSESQIADFQSGKFRVATGMMLLTEGFDYPGLNTVFVRPSGKLCTIQMAGRVLRKFPSLAHKNIVQAEDTKYPFPRAATPAEQHLWSDAGWRSLNGGKKLEGVTRRMQQILASCETSMPAFILKSRLKQRRIPRGDQGGYGPRPELEE